MCSQEFLSKIKNMNYYTWRLLKWKWTADGRGIDPRVRQHHFVEIGYGIISTAILSLALIQVEQLSITGERNLHLVLVNHLGRLPRNSVVRLTVRLDMTIVVDWDVKPQIKQTKN